MRNHLKTLHRLRENAALEIDNGFKQFILTSDLIDTALEGGDLRKYSRELMESLLVEFKDEAIEGMQSAIGEARKVVSQIKH